MNVSLDLSAEQQAALREIAARLRVAPDQLASAVVRDLLTARDAEFDDAARRVLEKNRELYRRLA